MECSIDIMIYSHSQDKALEDLGEFDPTMKKKKKKKKEFVPDGDDLPLDNDINGENTTCQTHH